MYVVTSDQLSAFLSHTYATVQQVTMWSKHPSQTLLPIILMTESSTIELPSPLKSEGYPQCKRVLACQPRKGSLLRDYFHPPQPDASNLETCFPWQQRSYQRESPNRSLRIPSTYFSVTVSFSMSAILASREWICSLRVRSATHQAHTHNFCLMGR